MHKRCAHLAHVPQARGLVLGIGQQVAAVALGVQVSKSLAVPHQHTSRLGPSPERPPIPHLQCVAAKPRSALLKLRKTFAFTSRQIVSDAGYI
jgi:hypothetical protein